MNIHSFFYALLLPLLTGQCALLTLAHATELPSYISDLGLSLSDTASIEGSYAINPSQQNLKNQLHRMVIFQESSSPLQATVAISQIGTLKKTFYFTGSTLFDLGDGTQQLAGEMRDKKTHRCKAFFIFNFITTQSPLNPLKIEGTLFDEEQKTLWNLSGERKWSPTLEFSTNETKTPHIPAEEITGRYRSQLPNFYAELQIEWNEKKELSAHIQTNQRILTRFDRVEYNADHATLTLTADSGTPSMKKWILSFAKDPQRGITGSGRQIPINQLEAKDAGSIDLVFSKINTPTESH